MRIINSLKTRIQEQYGLTKQDIIIFTYVLEKRFLFWKYYKIKQVLPDLGNPVKIKIKLTAQRDYQQMWEWLIDYKNKK